MEQTLYELGQQYLQQAGVIRDRIARERRELKSLHGEARHRAQVRLLKLYEMVRECDTTGEYLCTYYDEKGDSPCTPLQ